MAIHYYHREDAFTGLELVILVLVLLASVTAVIIFTNPWQTTGWWRTACTYPAIICSLLGQ